MNNEGITDFIEIMAERLPEYTWTEGTYIVMGEDLLLANKTVDDTGKKILPNHTYPITGPAQLFFIDKGDVKETEQGELVVNAEFSKRYHKRMMRKAWLSRQKTGLLAYLERFIEPAEMQAFREAFLGLKKEEDVQLA